MREEESAELSKEVASRLQGVDFGALDMYAVERRNHLRRRLEAPLDEVETATIRGQIIELKGLKKLYETVKRILAAK